MFDRIAFAIQSDCVRRPIRLRPPSIRINIECTQLAPSRIVIRIVACCGGRRPPLRFLFVPTVYLLLLIVVDLPFFAFASILYLKLRFR